MADVQTPHTIAFGHSWSKKMTVEEKRQLEALIKELQRNGRDLRPPRRPPDAATPLVPSSCETVTLPFFGPRSRTP